MKSKPFYGIIAVLFSFLFISCVSLPTDITSQKENKKIIHPFKTVEISEKLEYLDTKIKYPEFETYPELNKRIANSIQNNWKSFKSYSKSEWNEIVALNNRGTSKLPQFEYLVSFEVSGTSDIISVLLNTYIFSGGAHGNTNLSAINYQISTGKFIDIQKASGLTYNEISSICRNALYKKLIDNDKSGMPPAEQDALREMINTGAFPQAGNFEIYTVDDNKIYVYFEPYSVAPYSYGVQKIQIK